MKLVFQGDSLKEINQQILAAADELTREDVKQPGIEFGEHRTATQTLEIERTGKSPQFPQGIPKDRWVDAQPSIEAMQNSMVEDHSEPEVQGSPTTKQSKIDGYNVSDGKVWVPVEGRGSSYSGIEIDEYHRRKAAKESGGELDAAGTPYNPAIHTSTRTKTTKGLWKNRPGGGAVKAETPEVTHQVKPSQDIQMTVQAPATVQQVVAHEDSAPAIGRAPSMHNYESFKTNLMTIVVKLINENKITRDYMKDLNAYFQVANLWDVKNDDAKCQQLFKLFLEYQFIMGA